MFSHLLGKSPEEEIEEEGAWSLARRKERQHVVHEDGRSAVAKAGGVQEAVDEGPAGRRVAGEEVVLQLLIGLDGGVVDRA